jgi:hypothetical protein
MNRQEKAKLLCDEGFLEELSAAAKAEIVAEWERSEGIKEREECHAQMRAVDSVIRAMVGFANG